MSDEAPDDRLYSPDHVWLTSSGRVGVTHRFAAGLRPTSIQLPDVGTEIRAAEIFAVIEEEKASIDIFAPCDAVVSAINGELLRDPSLLVLAPYGDGWIAEVRPSSVGGLWTASEYSASGGNRVSNRSRRA